ncbi:uncharacterized aarF domain-containing protein kinase 2 isoform X2 [Anabrus simplex]|uniref:uncharacterized aarF domain-containing protein kinase 2 isoform X2 n=1 Tax=Anabrus simplex TaxID=316456 RepID=UPI0035A3C29E
MGLCSIFAVRFSHLAKGCVALNANRFLLSVLARTSKDHSSLLQRSRTAWGIFSTWSTSIHPCTIPVLNVVFPFAISERESICCTHLQQLQVKRQKKFKDVLSMILWTVWEITQTFIRIIQLICTFLPVLLLYPLSLICYRFKNVWYSVLLFGIEFSGPIFVKLGQWASTRRDIFPEELCSHLAKLQRKIRPHSWYYTKKTLEKAYGSGWRNVFVNIDKIPIGSGCCAQVYKAWINLEKLKTTMPLDLATFDSSKNSFIVEGLELLGVGNLLDCLTINEEMADNRGANGFSPVAVKVLHPRIETLLRRDLLILKTMADMVTWLIPSLRWLSLDDCVDDFSHLMKSQVNFCEEAHNLDVFTRNFQENAYVNFPRPFWTLTTPYILVETYEEGEHLEYYISSKEDDPIKKQLAEVGLNTLLKMVFEDNFAHGDLHPGNMLVQKVSPSEQPCQGDSFSFSFHKPVVPSFKLTILDCGIVSTLDERGRKCLKDVFAAVVDGNGEKVADLFLDHSNHQCEDAESFRNSMRDIVNSALKETVTLKQVEVSTLMTQLFSTMIKHRVKLDGSFSSVILAIMVLEGLGRSLDPSVDLVEKAKPFLLNTL